MEIIENELHFTIMCWVFVLLFVFLRKDIEKNIQWNLSIPNLIGTIFCVRFIYKKN